MRRVITVLVVSLILLAGKAHASFFETTVPVSWNIGFWPADDISWTLDESSMTADVILSEALTAVNQAFATWDNVLTAAYDFAYKPDLGGAYDFLDNMSGWDWSYANIVFGGWVNGSTWTTLPGHPTSSNIAGTWPFTLRDTDGTYSDYVMDADKHIDVDGNGRADLAQMVIYFNDSYLWGTDESGSKYDIETVAIHEIGHALGLTHSPDGIESVMTGNTDMGEVLRTLSAWDIAQVESIYPQPAAVPEPGALFLFLFGFILKPFLTKRGNK